MTVEARPSQPSQRQEAASSWLDITEKLSDSDKRLYFAAQKTATDYLQNGRALTEVAEQGYDWTSQFKDAMQDGLSTVYIQEYPPDSEFDTDIIKTAVAEATVEAVVEAAKADPTNRQLLEDISQLPVSQEVAIASIGDILDSYRAAYFEATYDIEIEYKSSEEAAAALDILGCAYINFASKSQPDSHELSVAKLSNLLEDYHTYKGDNNNSFRAEAAQQLASTITIDDKQSLDIEQVLAEALADQPETLEEQATKQTSKLAEYVKSHDVVPKAVAATAAVGVLSSGPAAAAVYNPGPISSPSVSISQAIYNDGATVEVSPATIVNETNINKLPSLKGKTTVNSMPTTTSLDETVSLGKEIAETDVTINLIEAKAKQKGKSKSEAAEIFKMLNQQMSPETVKKIVGGSELGQAEGSTNTDAEQVANNETLTTNPIDELRQTNDKLAAEDPLFAERVSESNRHLLSVLDVALDDPTKLSIILNGKDKQALLDGDFYGNADLVKAQQKEIFGEQGSGDYAEWTNEFDGSAKQEKLLKTIIATVESSLLSDNEILRLRDKYAPERTDVEKLASQEIINNAIPQVTAEKFSATAETKNQAKYKGFVNALRRLNERDSNIFPGWSGDIEELASIYYETSERYDRDFLTPEFLASQGFQESQFTKVIGSGAGALGIAQFMPGTWENWGKDLDGNGTANYNNPVEAIDAQARYMIWIYDNFTNDYEGDLRAYMALGGYNAGPGRIDQFGTDLIDGSLAGYFSLEPTHYVEGIQSILEVINDSETKAIEQVSTKAQSRSKSSDYVEQTSERQERIDELKEEGFTEKTITGSGEAMVPAMHGNFVYYNQGDVRFNDPESADYVEGYNLRVTGCGPSSLSMILSTELGRDGNNPLDIYKEVKAKDFYVEDVGTKHAALKEIPEAHGLDTAMLESLTLDSIKQAFENGAKYITINSDPSKTDGKAYHETGHIFTIIGVTENGKLLVLDSASYQKTQKAWNPKSILPYASETAAVAIAGKGGSMESYRQLVEKHEQAAAEAKQQKEAEQQAKKQEQARQNLPFNVRVVQEATERQPADMPNGIALNQQLKQEHGGVTGKLSASELTAIPGMGERLDDGAVEMHTVAAEYFKEMNEAFKAEFGYDIPVNDSYRSYADQVALKQQKPTLAATPGRSNHGSGFALDIQVGTRASSVYQWLQKHGGEYGWYNPKVLDSRYGPTSQDESWHFEFFGSAGHAR